MAQLDYANPSSGGASLAYDVAIVGAGPSGSTLAYRLAKLGVKTLLLDKATFPRKKPCGGACDGLFFKYLPKGMNIGPVIETWCEKVTIAYKDRFRETFTLDPPMAMTQRSKLDHCLVKQAVAAGAELREHIDIREIRKEGSEYKLGNVAEGVYRASIVVGADGAYSTVARILGYETPKQEYILSELDLPRDDQLEQPTDEAIVDLSVKPLSYWWQFPKGDHINVGFGVPRPQAKVLSSPDLLQSYAHRWGLTLDKPQWANRVSHMVPFARKGYEVTKGASLLIGDAAGLVDPNTGAGISWGIASGEWAEFPILNYLGGLTPDFSLYNEAYQYQLKEFEAGEALRNVLALSLVLENRGLTRDLIQETISYPNGKKTYLDWSREHPWLYQIGRLIQRFIVNRAFQKL